MPRTNVTTYSIIIAYNVFTLVGGFALDWPMGNVLLLAWAETVMFVVGGTAANARLRWQSRHGGRKICDDFAVATVDDATLNSALEHPASFFFRDLIFCLGHLGLAGWIAVWIGVSFSVTAFWVPLGLAVFRHLTEEFTDSLADPYVRRAKDLRAAHDADRRVFTQHFFVFAAWGLMIFLSVHGLSHVLILGMVGLYVVLKTFVEVQITWSRDHTVSVDQARAARVEKLMSGH